MAAQFEERLRGVEARGASERHHHAKALEAMHRDELRQIANANAELAEAAARMQEEQHEAREELTDLLRRELTEEVRRDREELRREREGLIRSQEQMVEDAEAREEDLREEEAEKWGSVLAEARQEAQQAGEAHAQAQAETAHLRGELESLESSHGRDRERYEGELKGYSQLVASLGERQSDEVFELKRQLEASRRQAEVQAHDFEASRHALANLGAARGQEEIALKLRDQMREEVAAEMADELGHELRREVAGRCQEAEERAREAEERAEEAELKAEEDYAVMAEEMEERVVAITLEAEERIKELAEANQRLEAQIQGRYM